MLIVTGYVNALSNLEGKDADYDPRYPAGAVGK